MSAWDHEPETGDETEHTPWAEKGWLAWNGMSPEVEFCELAGHLSRMLAPGLIIETGVGQGFTTRRVAADLCPGRQYIGFESDPGWRRTLIGLPFFTGPRHVSTHPTPNAHDFVSAALTILDSDPPFRMPELELWRKSAAPGAMLLVHDCGNGHPDGTIHAGLRQRIIDLRIHGSFLANPRGGFLGVQTR